MGPVNWIAVLCAWLVAAAVGLAFYGRAATPSRQLARHAIAALLLLLTAAMMGHMFARVGDATLAAKPWLYPMMSGGLALAFTGPALFIAYARRDLAQGAAWKDYGVWVITYLAMGGVFWAAG
ncbi:DUF1761 domain-containing protein [Erythrobacter arachoides]|uniref:DUF1761 domain-containing protein n=1 Tax=Aurantiacibacter arachoides TaxID=1850444 RepID=A0A844ZW82_9SPHN|nr:DUF1761 domain-containing protein [Aurantiacibacter arachoides]MXO92343.1 DUF1761 domain-containing protein [Aurantiacibacter arachoides]GGD57953.1 hypothetical protein GCM10011411_17480 [Aurantiacibacter arachoides]